MIDRFDIVGKVGAVGTVGWQHVYVYGNLFSIMNAGGNSSGN